MEPLTFLLLFCTLMASCAAFPDADGQFSGQNAQSKQPAERRNFITSLLEAEVAYLEGILAARQRTRDSKRLRNSHKKSHHRPPKAPHKGSHTTSRPHQIPGDLKKDISNLDPFYMLDPPDLTKSEIKKPSVNYIKVVRLDEKVNKHNVNILEKKSQSNYQDIPDFINSSAKKTSVEYIKGTENSVGVKEHGLPVKKAQSQLHYDEDIEKDIFYDDVETTKALEKEPNKRKTLQIYGAYQLYKPSPIVHKVNERETISDPLKVNDEMQKSITEKKTSYLDKGKKDISEQK